ncbi:hypothetical protein GOV14_03920 [Candidatus Pacearchaeota archaeon]|nr:hypothetical protein [Candidatus Pacearchaeota archaeon]
MDKTRGVLIYRGRDNDSDSYGIELPNSRFLMEDILLDPKNGSQNNDTEAGSLIGQTMRENGFNKYVVLNANHNWLNWRWKANEKWVYNGPNQDGTNDEGCFWPEPSRPYGSKSALMQAIDSELNRA